MQFVFPEVLPETPWNTRFVTGAAFSGLAALEFFWLRRAIHVVTDLRATLRSMKGRNPGFHCGATGSSRRIK